MKRVIATILIAVMLVVPVLAESHPCPPVVKPKPKVYRPAIHYTVKRDTVRVPCEPSFWNTGKGRIAIIALGAGAGYLIGRNSRDEDRNYFYISTSQSQSQSQGQTTPWNKPPKKGCK